TCLGFAGSRSTGYLETEFHRLLISTGRIKCSHRWQAFFWNHHNTHPGEVHIPIVLTDYGWSADQLGLLAKLKDPDKIAAILTSAARPDGIDGQHLMEIGAAFEKRMAVPLAISESDWWAEHRPLFVGRLPATPALQRIRPAAALSGPIESQSSGPGR